ncbi:unnamed protein product [Cyclocybe aegerita]|uniref:Uncharacterized protein n=1 Tax=Cyclocybe aegerita TaxID=1973307 RepID=A0A8S0W4P5_CYCAE|nr:unnamed protein product [Cyclocybe aegerita]
MSHYPLRSHAQAQAATGVNNDGESLINLEEADKIAVTNPPSPVSATSRRSYRDIVVGSRPPSAPPTGRVVEASMSGFPATSTPFEGRAFSAVSEAPASAPVVGLPLSVLDYEGFHTPGSPPDRRHSRPPTPYLKIGLETTPSAIAGAATTHKQLIIWLLYARTTFHNKPPASYNHPPVLEKQPWARQSFLDRSTRS